MQFEAVPPTPVDPNSSPLIRLIYPTVAPFISSLMIRPHLLRPRLYLFYPNGVGLNMGFLSMTTCRVRQLVSCCFVSDLRFLIRMELGRLTRRQEEENLLFQTNSFSNLRHLPSNDPNNGGMCLSQETSNRPLFRR